MNVNMVVQEKHDQHGMLITKWKWKYFGWSFHFHSFYVLVSCSCCFQGRWMLYASMKVKKQSQQNDAPSPTTNSMAGSLLNLEMHVLPFWSSNFLSTTSQAQSHLVSLLAVGCNFLTYLTKYKKNARDMNNTHKAIKVSDKLKKKVKYVFGPFYFFKIRF